MIGASSRCQGMVVNKRLLTRTISSQKTKNEENVIRRVFQKRYSSTTATEQHDPSKTTTTTGKIEPPKTTGETLRSPTFGKLPPDASEMEKNAFLLTEEKRQRNKRIGSLLQIVGGVGLVISAAVFLYLTKMEEEEDEEKNASHDGSVLMAEELGESPEKNEKGVDAVHSSSLVSNDNTAAYEQQISSLKRELEQLNSEMGKIRANRDEELSAQQLLIGELEKQLAQIKKDHELAVARHEQEVMDKLEEQKHDFSIQYQEDNMKRVEAIDQLAARVHGLNYVYYENAQYFDDSYELQKLSVGIVALQQALKTSGPLKPEMDALSKVNRVAKDELVQLLLESIPQNTVVSGTPKMMDLERSFRKVKKQAFGASYAPNDMGFLGKIYSKFASLFVLNEEGFIEGKDVGAVLARAHYYLQHEMLDQAIWELSTTESNGEVSEQLQEWLTEANNRLQVDQVNGILANHLINLTESRDTYLFPPPVSQEGQSPPVNAESSTKQE